MNIKVFISNIKFIIIFYFKNKKQKNIYSDEHFVLIDKLKKSSNPLNTKEQYFFVNQFNYLI